MKVNLLITALVLSFIFNCYSQTDSFKNDSLSVDRLNELAYNIRLTDPDQTLQHAKKALNLATKIGYSNGSAEAQRVMGIGYFYIWKNEQALSHYLKSLTGFKKTNYKPGLAKVYNNIGNLYREIDFEKGLMYFNRSLVVANQLDMTDLIAGANLNIGIIYFRQKKYNLALSCFEKSYKMFTELKNPVGITQSLHNQGVIYFNVKKTALAEKILLESIQNAKQNELNSTVASINLTLTAIYINQGRFAKAEEALNEGKAYTELVKDAKLQQDYTFTSYQLEYKRKNYKQALEYLRQVYTQDSIQFNNIESQKIGLLQEQQRHMEREKQTLILIERQKTNRVMLWASVIVLILLAAVIMLLYLNNKKKAKTNKQLQTLNDEVSLQKENLDRINHNLEEIITERTLDLQIKNKKLSDYSAHLSHQIRSPIATMKGLMMLEEDHLIENEEFVKEIGKCINDIDDKIRNINANLHSLENKEL
ncbi:tetratricopeptide repeat protein [Arcticibacter sp.]|uniref:tetratricopeptide repeat protein n=1 Tax=Arcticibacter sp. TaxID=1872630 RepID=UPI00388FAB9A